MSRRAARVLFGLLVMVFGTMVVYAVMARPAPLQSPLWLAVLCEIAVVVTGGVIVFTAPPAAVAPAAPDDAPAPPAPSSVYRGAQPPLRIDPITKASAKRITIGILAALAFTGATVPFAFHLPRWIEGELVVGLWWAIWSVVLGVVAYRGAALDDDHRPGGAVVDLKPSEPTESWRPKWSWLLEGIGDPEGCLIAIAMLVVVGIALLGAWLVVELVAPAVFVLAYRGVVRALRRAHAAKTHGDAARSALVGMGWAAVYSAPLAGVVALAHAIVAVRAS